MEICPYGGNENEWDGFVEHHPEGRFFLLSGFKKAIQETYGYEGHYYLFKRDGEIAAILPSFRMKSLLSRRLMLSLPFAEYGGLLGKDLSLDEVREIAALLQETLLEQDFPSLEMHGGLGISQDLMCSTFHQIPMYQYAILPLHESTDIWDNVLDRQVRKAVRKAQKANLSAYEETTEESILQKFYPLYLASMKRLGTPPHTRKLFLNYFRYLKDNMKLFIVNDGDLSIAALLGFTTGKRVHIIHIGSDPEHWGKRPNDLVHWAFIEWACNEGYEIFDFSVVRYEGQRRYKEKWGAQLLDYSYYYMFPDNGAKVDISPMDPSSRRSIRWSSWLWRHCVPLRLTEPLGSPIRRRLGR